MEALYLRTPKDVRALCLYLTCLYSFKAKKVRMDEIQKLSRKQRKKTKRQFEKLSGIFRLFTSLMESSFRLGNYSEVG